MSKWYGSLHNRLEENTGLDKEITVGMGMTEYYWSDREPWEVINVIDQKHIEVRRLDHKHIGEGYMDNNWELISNPDNTTGFMTRRGKYWYWTITATQDLLKELETANDMRRCDILIFLANNGIDVHDLETRKKITRYRKANVSFGRAEYYYDYEF